MPDKKYHKSDIAKEQLKTAILLFLNGRDRASAITLAGAAGAILERLVRNSGGVPFVDYACNVHNHLQGTTPARQKYNRHINDKFGINDLKHMRPDSPETLEIDLDKCAADAILKAVADYKTLYGAEEDFIKGFFTWAWMNLDGPQIMKDYADFTKKMKKP
jgi:hypothetical protein